MLIVHIVHTHYFISGKKKQGAWSWYCRLSVLDRC